MKRLFVLILTITIVASLFCISAFAAEDPASDIVLRVSATMRDGSTKVIKDYTSFEDGWNAAMELASNPKELNKNDYARVIVDLYADWNAVNGEFTKDFFNGKGFNWDAIYFPANIKVTLNLNGNTINRGLTEYQYNGEVLYIDKDAEVIINGDGGSITGGWSCNGAGGIHINDGAYVTLNNVNVVGNVVEDDDGAGIALYNGAHLTMDGGSISNNVVYSASRHSQCSYGALYLDEATATLNNVTISGNVAKNYAANGVAIYISNSDISLNGCVIENNGYTDENKNYVSALSIIYGAFSANLTVTDTEFKNNGSETRIGDKDTANQLSSLIYWHNATSKNTKTVNLSNSTFTGNKMDTLFYMDKVDFTFSDCTVTDNYANVLYAGTNKSSYQNPVLGGASANKTAGANIVTVGVIKSCTFNNNSLGKSAEAMTGETKLTTFFFSGEKRELNVSFTNCEFGNSTFTNKNLVRISNSSFTGSLFSEGSLTIVVAIAALVTSITSICLTVVSNKKKKEEFKSEEK